MTTQHPEALRLAAELDDGYPLTGDAISAAAELRRQHARITELESQLAQRFDAADMATAAQQGVAYAELPDERAAFEAWLRSVWTAGYSCPKLDSGKYVHGDAQRFWECWQARAAHGQAPAEVSPTAGMNIPQRILHVGGRNNDAGYVEFGSIQAVEALVRQVLRDLPALAQADSVTAPAGGATYHLGACIVDGALSATVMRKEPGRAGAVTVLLSEQIPVERLQDRDVIVDVTPPAQAADSVQEDAARLDWLIEQQAYVVSDPDACPGHWLHWARPDGSTWVQGDEHPTPRAAIDAARKQGEKQ